MAAVTPPQSAGLPIRRAPSSLRAHRGMRTALVMLSVLGAAAISPSHPRPALLRLRGGGPTASIQRSAAAVPDISRLF